MADPDLFALCKLAEAKGFEVMLSTMRGHVRLIDSDGNLVKNQNSGAAFSLTEARRYLEGQDGRPLGSAR